MEATDRNDRFLQKRSRAVRCIYKFGSAIRTLFRRHLWFQAYLAAISGLGLGYFVEVNPLKPLIPVALFAMLYPAMLDLRGSSIKKILISPKMLVTALVINLLISPCLIFGLITANSSPFLVAGLLLFGLIPCGGMVPAYTSMLGGNVNLSTTIMAISLVLSIGTFPLWTSIFLGQYIAMPIALITKYLALIIVVPMFAAILTRRLVIRTADEATFFAVKSRLMGLARFGLLFVVFLFFSLNGSLLFDHPLLVLQVAIPVSLFLVILIGLCSLISRFSASSREDSIALTISSTAKNNAVGLAIAVAAFNPKVALVITIAGPMVQLPIMLTYLWWRNRPGLGG